jgi:hypothetical protein
MRRAAVSLALLLAACGQRSAPPEANQAAANSSVAEPADNGAAALNASGNEGAGDLGSLPPANAALRFVGQWATSKSNCASKPWRFTATELTVADGPNCHFYKVSKSPGGYDLAAQCPTKKPVPTDLIKLRFAESARAMLVESNAIPPTGLIYCGKQA